MSTGGADALVRRDDRDGLATLTLNRPAKLNALTHELMVQLREQLAAVAADTSIGCVCLIGAGRSFCAGHDLSEVGQDAHSLFDAETVDLLERLPQPTIAAVRGHCLTGGLELALGCDLIVCTDTAVFADTHGEHGLVAIWGMSVRLPERVGRARALELAFTARRVGGQEAAALGLAERCVDNDRLEDEVSLLAAAILHQSWSANAMVKRLARDEADMTRVQALAFERTRPYGLPSRTDGRH